MRKCTSGTFVGVILLALVSVMCFASWYRISDQLFRGFRYELRPKSSLTRRRLQFSLRTLLAAMFAACGFLGWIAFKRGEAAEQRAAYQLIVAKGGLTNIGSESNRPIWMQWILGEDVAADGGCIDFGRSELTDADLAQLSSLQQIQRLSLRETPISNQGLVHLSKLKNLRYLSLDDTSVTDDGVASLRACQSLELLSLYHTRTTTLGVTRLQMDLPYLTVIDSSDVELPAMRSQGFP